MNIKNLKKQFASEDGAAYVLEATIIYPIVFLVVILLIFVGLTFMQKAYLQTKAADLSSYIVKAVKYPGFEYIITPDDYYENKISKKGELSAESMAGSASVHKPYRYLTGFFSTDSLYEIHGKDKENVITQLQERMVNEYLPSHGMIQPTDKDSDAPIISQFTYQQTKRSGGYALAIIANTKRVTVYICQNYTFSKLFNMIGLGGRISPIFAEGTAFVNDSIEFVRLTDMAFDAMNFIAGKLNIDTKKIREIIDMLTGNGG